MTPAAAAPSGPVVDRASVTFRLPDPYRRLRTVRLAQEVRIPGDQTDLSYGARAWTLTIDRPEVDRMEYLFEIEDHNERRSSITDPHNPLRVAGAFGDKSVVEFPEYRPPYWLELERVAGGITELEVTSDVLDEPVSVGVWTPHDLPADRPAPLLVAHDGPEYAALACLTDYLAALVDAGTVPPLRAALIAPGERNRWYSANPDYARVLCEDVVAQLADAVPITVRIGMGASLGALAMLHAQRSYPGTFDGLFLQSGSFFRPALDPQEKGFSGFAPVTDFVAGVASAADAVATTDGADSLAVPVALTCGAIEENLENNRAMAEDLRRLGYAVTIREVRDVHNYTAWRDAFDPDLTELIRTVAGVSAA